MTANRAWAARSASALGVAVVTLVWLPRPASAGFLSGAAASATYATAVMAAPTGLAASVSGQTVTLTWALPTSPAPAGTQLWRAASPAGPLTAIASVPAPTSTLSDTPGPGVWYYTAESYRGAWTSPAAGPVSATVAALPSWQGQVASGSSPSGGTTLTVAVTSAVTVGDVLTVRTAVGSSASVTSITDSAGDTYLAQAAVSQHKTLTSELWTATVTHPLPAGSSIAVAWSQAGGDEAVMVDAFSAVTAVTDGSATASGHSTTPTATTTATAGDLVVAATATTAGPGGYSEAAGWTPLGSTSVAGGGSKSLSLYGGWQIAASPTVTHAPTLSASTDWTEADVALRAG